MSVAKFEGRLDEEIIMEAYGMYLQKHANERAIGLKPTALETILAYEEFKEYYILKILGRAGEFMTNIARDYQYASILKSPSSLV